MDPKKHDALLVDDSAFSRSRMYFWAISTLTEFDKTIADTIDQWEISRKIWEKEWSKVDKEDWFDNKGSLEEVEALADQLRGFRAAFNSHRDEVIALRDGLFNASAVMESRDANRLGGKLRITPLNIITTLLNDHKKMSNSLH